MTTATFDVVGAALARGLADFKAAVLAGDEAAQTRAVLEIADLVARQAARIDVSDHRRKAQLN